MAIATSGAFASTRTAKRSLCKLLGRRPSRRDCLYDRSGQKTHDVQEGSAPLRRIAAMALDRSVRSALNMEPSRTPRRRTLRHALPCADVVVRRQPQTSEYMACPACHVARRGDASRQPDRGVAACTRTRRGTLLGRHRIRSLSLPSPGQPRAMRLLRSAPCAHPAAQRGDCCAGSADALSACICYAVTPRHRSLRWLAP